MISSVDSEDRKAGQLLHSTRDLPADMDVQYESLVSRRDCLFVSSVPVIL